MIQSQLSLLMYILVVNITLVVYLSEVGISVQGNENNEDSTSILVTMKICLNSLKLVLLQWPIGKVRRSA